MNATPSALPTRLAVLNCGSSSIKFALFDASAGAAALPREPLWSGKIQGIGSAQARWQSSDGQDQAITLGAEQPYHQALALIRAAFRTHVGGGRVRVAVNGAGPCVFRLPARTARGSARRCAKARCRCASPLQRLLGMAVLDRSPRRY